MDRSSGEQLDKAKKAEKPRKDPENNQLNIFQYSPTKKNEEVYRDYVKTGENKIPPPWGKTAGAEQGKEFFVMKNKLFFCKRSLLINFI